MFAFLASLGLPALAGFSAEVLVFFAANRLLGYFVIIPMITILATAGYYLWAYQRAFQGPLNPKFERAEIHDLKPFETAALSVLAALIVLYGCLPFLFTDYVLPYSTQLAGVLRGETI
jgi:NADH-quinone oxidoreductase subunit M